MVPRDLREGLSRRLWLGFVVHDLLEAMLLTVLPDLVDEAPVQLEHACGPVQQVHRHPFVQLKYPREVLLPTQCPDMVLEVP